MMIHRTRFLDSAHIGLPYIKVHPITITKMKFILRASNLRPDQPRTINEGGL